MSFGAQVKITVTVGRDLVSMLDVQRRTIELTDIDRRLTALERRGAVRNEQPFQRAT
jgi:hypothetical protein